MFGIGGFELFIILLFGFLIFGPDKLPEIAKTVGKGIARFRQAQQEMNETLGDQKIFDPNNPDEPFKNPVEVLDKMAQRQEEKKAKAAGTAQKADGSAADSAPKAAAPAPTEPAAEEPPGQAAPARAESFTERKARYERERAAAQGAREGASDGAADAVAADPASKGGE